MGDFYKNNPEKCITVDKFLSSQNSLISRLEEGSLVEKGILVSSIASNFRITHKKGDLLI